MPDSEQTFVQTQASETLTLSRKSRGISMATGLAGTGQKQWEDVMKKFHESRKQTCKAIPKKMPKVPREQKKFPTGSTYTGDWNMLGMSGKGVYAFPHKGIIYKGHFDDGMFDGNGELLYDCGAIVKGKWKKGKLIEKSLMFADGLHYEEKDWAYCRYPDRRYTAEHDNYIQPAGLSYVTADQPPKYLPPGFYDTGDGVYDPKTKMVYKYDDLTAIVRSPDCHEKDWIKANCRFNCDIPLGPCSFLYEDWVEPLLESEDPPPPRVRTKTCQEEVADVLIFGKGSSTSRSSMTSMKRSLSSRVSIPLFVHSFGHRRVTEMANTNTDFYVPPDAVQSTSTTRASTLSMKRQQSRQMSRVSYIDDRSMSSSFRPSKANMEPGMGDAGGGADDDLDYDEFYFKPKGRPPPNW